MNTISRALVERAVGGDASAVSTLVSELQRPFFHLALRMLMQHEDAEEAAQEALLKVITRLASWRGESAFTTWAWSVATRSVLDYERTRGRRPWLTFDGFAEDLQTDLDEGAVERPEDSVLLAQVKIGCSRALLQCLDSDHRIAYVMGEIMEVPGPEAATALEISPEVYRKRLSRARERMAAALRQNCGLVRTDNPCACHKRLRPAQTKGRLDPRDGAEGLDLPALRKQVQDLSEIAATAAVYRADPQASVAERILPQLHRALGLS